jgi:hypothetical protein
MIRAPAGGAPRRSLVPHLRRGGGQGQRRHPARRWPPGGGARERALRSHGTRCMPAAPSGASGRRASGGGRSPPAARAPGRAHAGACSRQQQQARPSPPGR